jgi:hypothetical protein
MPRTRTKPGSQRRTLALVSYRKRRGHRRTTVTLGDLIFAATQAAGSAQGAARLLDPTSPLGHLLDHRIVIH